MAKPLLAIAENRASARIRAFASVNVVVTSAIVLGPAMAAPTPWTARATISSAAESARPPASEARVNTAVPRTNSRRRPNRSPARPPSSRSPPKTRL